MKLPDLSRIPREALEAELARRKRGRGQPPKLASCPKCGVVTTAALRRRPCPHNPA
jgi:hypothetical protein